MTYAALFGYAVGACLTFGVIMSGAKSLSVVNVVVGALIGAAIWPVVWLVAIGAALGKWGAS